MGAMRDYSRLRGRRIVAKCELAFVLVDFDLAAVLQLAEEDFVGQNSFDLILD